MHHKTYKQYWLKNPKCDCCKKKKLLSKTHCYRNVKVGGHVKLASECCQDNFKKRS